MDFAGMGRRIAERQQAMGLTAAELAKRLGCSESHISRVKAGKSGKISYDDIRNWAAEMEVTATWLATGEEADFQSAVSRLGADPDISKALATLSVWFETTTEHNRAVFRHVLKKWADLLNRRDTRIKEPGDRDLVEFS